jgi:hypothetical protein
MTCQKNQLLAPPSGAKAVKIASTPKVKTTVMFRPLNPNDSNIGRLSPSGKENETMHCSSTCDFTSASAASTFCQDKKYLQLPARAQRFKLPCSSGISLKMRRSHFFQEARPKTSCQTRRSLFSQTDEETRDSITGHCTPSKTSQDTPREFYHHNVQSSPPMMRLANRFQDIEMSGPFPSKICLPML